MRCQIKALGLYFCANWSIMLKNGLIAFEKRVWPVEGNLKVKQTGHSWPPSLFNGADQFLGMLNKYLKK